MFYLFTLTMTKIQKNSPIYGVTTGLWLIASGTSPVTPGAQKTTSGPYQSTVVLREKAFT